MNYFETSNVYDDISNIAILFMGCALSSDETKPPDYMNTYCNTRYYFTNVNSIDIFLFC